MIRLSDSSSWRLRRLSLGDHGHTLNHRQVFSPNGQYAAFDSRNSDSEIISTDRIGRIELDTGAVEWLYQASSPTPYGPGVGAVACDPERDRLIFIHGLRSCGPSRPYSTTRRFGAWLDLQAPAHSVEHAEARHLSPTPSWGVLRGGTHAHSWSRDGKAISFTYNDAWVEQQHLLGVGPPDARTVGVMMCDVPATVDEETDEQFSGRCWSMVVASVTENAMPGSDAIESAREECFLGQSSNRVALIGRVRGCDGAPIDEIFIAQWPANLDLPSGPANTDRAGRLVPPQNVQLERLTRTEHRRYPGIGGPRCWLLSSIDGQVIYTAMRDDSGVVQVVAVDVSSGNVEPVTELTSSLESPLALNTQSTLLSLMSRGRVGILDLQTRRIVWSPELREQVEIPWGAFHFLPDDSGLLFHAYDQKSGAKRQRIWTLSIH
jgi:hypothetical protein